MIIPLHNTPKQGSYSYVIALTCPVDWVRSVEYIQLHIPYSYRINISYCMHGYASFTLNDKCNVRDDIDANAHHQTCNIEYLCSLRS